METILKLLETEVVAMEPRNHAEAFLQDRINRYERMWDGCGCGIRYYE